MSSATSSGEQPEQLQQEEPGSNLAGASAFAAALAREVEGDEEPGDTGDDGSGKPGERPTKGKPKDLAELAERLGVQVAELYDITIPAGSGREAMKLGQLKDRFESWGSLEADRLAFSETQVAHQAEIERGKQELRELLSVIPRQHLTQEALQRAAARVAERHRAQDAQVLEVFPEWKDPAKRQADIGEYSKMLEGYGLSAAEVKAIRDPRLLRFIRDSHRRAEQVRKALEAVKPAARKPQQQNTASGAPRRQGQQQQRQSLRPQTGRERFSELLNQEL